MPKFQRYAFADKSGVDESGLAAGERTFAALRSLGHLIVDQVGVMP